MPNKFQEHTYNVLNQMAQEATGDPLVYTGYLTKLIGSICSPTYYGKIVRTLIDMGAIEQYARGGGTAASQWRILRTIDSPSEVTNLDDRPRSVKKRETLESRVALLEQRLEGVPDIALAFREVNTQQQAIYNLLSRMGVNDGDTEQDRLERSGGPDTSEPNGNGNAA
jgi:hypothetical protein